MSLIPIKYLKIRYSHLSLCYIFLLLFWGGININRYFLYSHDETQFYSKRYAYYIQNTYRIRNDLFVIFPKTFLTREIKLFNLWYA